MSVVQFPEGSRHGGGGLRATAPQLVTSPITPSEQPSWPDEAACTAVSRAQLDVDAIGTAAQAAGLDDVQQAAEDAVSALEHLGRTLADHYQS